MYSEVIKLSASLASCSSNISFYYPANLLVFISMKTSEIMRGSRASDISGMGKMTLPLKYREYLTNLSLSYSSGLICRTFQEAGVLLPVGLCPVCIGLLEGIDYCVFLGQETGRAAPTSRSFIRFSWKGFFIGLKTYGDPQKDQWRPKKVFGN